MVTFFEKDKIQRKTIKGEKIRGEGAGCVIRIKHRRKDKGINKKEKSIGLFYLSVLIIFNVFFLVNWRFDTSVDSRTTSKLHSYGTL